MDKTVKIIKKALGKFFSRLQTLTNFKVSEKSNKRFPRKSVTHKQTNGRTDATPKVSTTSWSRDQKKVHVCQISFMLNHTLQVSKRVEKLARAAENFRKFYS